MMDEVHMEKVLLASTSASLGVCCTILLVVLVSVLPDCSFVCAFDFLIVFAVQCAIHALLLVISMVNVSYSLASDRDTFINPSVDVASSHLAVFCLDMVVALQFYIAARRYIDFSFPSLMPFNADRRASRLLAYSAIIVAGVLASNHSVNNILSGKTLSYNLLALRWMYNEQSVEDSYRVLAVVVSALAILGTLYLVSILFTLINSTRQTANENRLEHTWDFAWLTFNIIADVGYALLLLYCHWIARPTPLSGRSTWTPPRPAFAEGLMQSVGPILYALLSNFLVDDVLRQALGFRASKLVNGVAPISSPTLPRRAIRCSISHDLRPLFMQPVRDAKMSNGSLRRPPAAV